MHINRRLGAAIGSALVLAALIPASASAAPVLKQLPGLPGASGNGAWGINDSGVAVGWANVAKTSHAVRWAADGTITDLGTAADDTGSGATAINNAGTAAGSSSGSKGQRAATWSSAGQISLLPSLPDAVYCEAEAINESGATAGYCSPTYSSTDRHAVRWTADGTHVTDLGALAGSKGSGATAIGRDGTVAGWAYGSDYEQHAMRWSPDGTATTLANLPDGYYSSAAGINDSGAIVGKVQASIGSSYGVFAVRWDPDGTVTTLKGADVADHPDSELFAISSAGVAVGLSTDAAGNDNGARWGADGTFTDLGSLAGSGNFTFATAVNTAGVIVGSSGGNAVRWAS